MDEQFLKDLVDSVALVKANPNAFPDGLAPMYGLAATLPDRSIIADIGKTYLDAILETQK